MRPLLKSTHEEDKPHASFYGQCKQINNAIMNSLDTVWLTHVSIALPWMVKSSVLSNHTQYYLLVCIAGMPTSTKQIQGPAFM